MSLVCTCAGGQKWTEIGLTGISPKGEPRKSAAALTHTTMHWHTGTVPLCNSKWHPLWL